MLSVYSCPAMMKTRDSIKVVGALSLLAVVSIGCSRANQTTVSAPGSYQPSPEIGPTDLSLCNTASHVAGNTTIDARDFARALHGTWFLNGRTIDGLLITTNSYFYFDMNVEKATAGEVQGTAMMLDAGNLDALDPLYKTMECPKDASLGAFWKVKVSTGVQGREVSLMMDGDYQGSYGEFQKGMTFTEVTSFVKRNDAYLAGGLVTPAGGMGKQDVWDRISLMGRELIYLSCKDAFVEQYVKVADDRPRVDGVSLGEAWLGKKTRLEMLNPSYRKTRSRGQ
jgi:hypothetical protein